MQKERSIIKWRFHSDKTIGYPPIFKGEWTLVSPLKAVFWINSVEVYGRLEEGPTTPKAALCPHRFQ